MKTTKRFDNAVIKLYNAFHENRLVAMDCTACAVGNLCDNSRAWIDHPILSEARALDETNINEFVDVPNIMGTNYSALELAQIENLFMFGYKLEINYKKKDCISIKFPDLKERHFVGLCAVIEYLCELDNIENVMDYTKLFETEENAPKHILEAVLSM